MECILLQHSEDATKFVRAKQLSVWRSVISLEKSNLVIRDNLGYLNIFRKSKETLKSTAVQSQAI